MKKDKDSLSLLKEELKAKSPMIGTDVTIKLAKSGKAKKVFFTKNCPTETKEDLKHYSKIFNYEVYELSIDSGELGIICKKPFPIAVLSYDWNGSFKQRSTWIY